MAKFVAISDLHITGADDSIYPKFLRVIDSVESGDVLVLGGDIFDLFVAGRKLFCERYSAFVNRVEAALSRGVTVHYIEGNHDFFMRSAFSDQSKIRIHEKEVKFVFEHKSFYIAHGDLVDSADSGYLFLRKALRSVPIKFLMHRVPDFLVDRIGQKSSKASRGSRKTHTSSDFSIEQIEKLRSIFRGFAEKKLSQGFDFVVLGHCHDDDEKIFQSGKQYINVGFPKIHGTYLCWSPERQVIIRKSLPE